MGGEGSTSIVENAGGTSIRDSGTLDLCSEHPDTVKAIASITMGAKRFFNLLKSIFILPSSPLSQKG
jgi:hypothetical protein